jgi:hypothetical protein
MRSSWVHLVFRSFVVPPLTALAVFLNAGPGEAQTFRFQLEPYCDKVVLTFVPSGSSSVLGIVGYDDNCGDLPRSPIHGTAVMNPDGSFTIGYTTSLPFSVYGRSDVGLQTSVEIPANSSVGSWTDDDGLNGTFEFDILDQPSG